MTPSQHALKAYILAKIGEGAFSGLRMPAAVAKKAAAELAADLPVAMHDMLDMASESAAKIVGQVVLKKIGDVAADISRRGLGTVAREIKESLDMQYQRGVERQRKRQGG